MFRKSEDYKNQSFNCLRQLIRGKLCILKFIHIQKELSMNVIEMFIFNDYCQCREGNYFNKYQLFG